METKKVNTKIEILTDMKKITVENSRAKAEKLAIKIKRKYKKLPKAYRIMYLQHLVEVKELTPLEVIFFNQFINK
jgi:acetylornithine/succinyldiaminopimelate/putrescine aminotransferase